MQNFEQDVFKLVVLNNGEFGILDDTARHQDTRRPDAEHFLGQTRDILVKEHNELLAKLEKLDQLITEADRLTKLQNQRYGLDS